MSEGEGDLPLHDEAKARSKWRDGETLIDEDGRGGSGPASEIDDAASGGGSVPDSGDRPAEDLARRPPD
jgi:hypothetical protein